MGHTDRGHQTPKHTAAFTVILAGLEAEAGGHLCPPQRPLPRGMSYSQWEAVCVWLMHKVCEPNCNKHTSSHVMNTY